MVDTVKRQTAKQQAKAATPNKPATANLPPRQVKRAPPIAPSAQTAATPPPVIQQQVVKPPAIEQRPKQQLSTLMSTTAPLDGFSGFSEEIEGVEHSQGASAGQGTMLKFTENGKWVTGAGDPMSLECELVVVDLQRIVQKWIDGAPVEKIIVEPGKKFPNVEAMNNAAPQSEWREYRGEMMGPWQMEYVVYLLDAATLDSYWFPTSTTGGGMCCRDIARKIAWMRQYRGPKVSAVVTLSDTFMNTKWGGRQRPHFQIVRWIGFGQATASEVKSPASKPALESGAAATPETPPWKEVKEPSLAEEMNDVIPDFNDDVSNI